MPQIPLPILEDAVPVVIEAPESLAAFLAPPGDPQMQARLGVERVVAQSATQLQIEGERFATRDGWVQGLRWLTLDALSGQAIAVLNLTLRKQARKTTAVVSNLYVRPECRRQGLAFALVDQARAQFPRLVADSALSPASLALFGHAPSASAPPAPVHRAPKP